MQPHVLQGKTSLRLEILGISSVSSALPEAPDGRLPWSRQLQHRFFPFAGSAWGRSARILCRIILQLPQIGSL